MGGRREGLGEETSFEMAGHNTLHPASPHLLHPLRGPPGLVLRQLRPHSPGRQLLRGQDASCSTAVERKHSWGALQVAPLTCWRWRATSWRHTSCSARRRRRASRHSSSSPLLSMQPLYHHASSSPRQHEAPHSLSRGSGGSGPCRRRPSRPPTPLTKKPGAMLWALRIDVV